MKILQVRFANLNSLAGEWLIDFTDPIFSSNGIYAIIGNTGAGKSSILDAISLALYGRTPRLKQISKSTNEIMSRHTGYCFSEVEFISAKGHFRCHWSQHRARKSAQGELQPPRHEFVDADKNKILSTKLKDVAARVIQATGMDFDQFTRSMLLAQGEFSKFLQASPDERAPILEQITGTEIFSQISQHVHLRYSTEKVLLSDLRQEMAHYQLMSLDEENQCIKELQNHTTLADQTLEEISQTNNLLNYHNLIIRLEESINKLTGENQELNKKWLELQPERQKLQQAEAAQAIQGLYSHLKQQRLEQETESLSLQETNNKLKEAKTQLESGLHNLEITEKELLTELLTKQKTDAILKEVRKLDLLVDSADREQRSYEKALQKHVEQKSTLLEQLTQYSSKIEVITREKDKLHNYLSQNAKHEALVETFSGLKEIFTNYSVKNREISTLQTEITELGNQQKEVGLKVAEKKEHLDTLTAHQLDIQNNLLEIEQQEKQLPTTDSSSLYTSLQEMREETAELDKLAELTITLEKITNEGNKAVLVKEKKVEEINNVQQYISDKLQIIKLVKSKIEQQAELVLLANKIESYEKERKKLQENKPCPLCGSCDHPFIVEQNIIFSCEEEQLKKEQSHLEIEEKTLKDLEINQSILSVELEKITKTLKENEKLEENLIQEQLLLSQTQNLQVDDALPSRTKEKKSVLEAAIVNQQTAIDKYNALVKERQSLEREINKTTAALVNASEAHLGLRHKLSTLQEKSQLLGTELVKKTKERKVFLKVLLTQTAPYQLEEDLSTDPLKALKELDILRNRWKEKYLKLEEQRKTMINLESQVQQHKSDIAHLNQESKTKEQALAGILSEKNNLALQRKNLLGEKDPDVVEQQLIKKIEVIEQKKTTSQRENNKIDLQVTTLSERQSQLSTSIQNRVVLLDQLEKSFEQQLVKHGFSSEEALTGSFLSPAEFGTLKSSLEKLQQKRLTIQTQLQISQDELLKEQKKDLTPNSIAELNGLLTEKNKQLNELQQKIGLLKGKLETQKQVQKNQSEKLQQIQAQEIELEYWGQLHTLIGSADGKKFRNFAQGLTFELMIYSANVSLRRMTDRYLLIRDLTHPLKLNVIDNYQAGETRSTANLSGGESFIISLALALGLSSMASKRVQVDSLFLDEGFGTLDEESLELALEALNQLQQQGKIIGIISHVPLLKERISVQLQLTAGPDGRSKIVGPGVTPN